MAPLYVCAECQNSHVTHEIALGVEMIPEKNHIYVIEMADFGPYKVWFADLWRCPKCGHKVIAGFGLKCVSQHYQDNFQAVLERAQASGEIYYC